MKKHIFKILFSTTLVIVVASVMFFEGKERYIDSSDVLSVLETKPEVRPYLEPKPEIAATSYLEPKKVEKLSYSELLVENPALANIKTYKQLDEYYHLETATEIPEGAVPVKLNSLEEAIKYLENSRRDQERNR